MILAGLGGDVIKIERSGSGDDARHMAPVAEQWSAYFVAINRGKRSAAVDLGTPDGVAVVLRMAAQCDVFIENFRGGKADAGGQGDGSFVGQAAGDRRQRGLRLLDIADAQRAGMFQALAEECRVARGNLSQNAGDQARLGACQSEQGDVRIGRGEDRPERCVAQVQ